jgi:hypothetical protein
MFQRLPSVFCSIEKGARIRLRWIKPGSRQPTIQWTDETTETAALGSVLRPRAKVERMKIWLQIAKPPKQKKIDQLAVYLAYLYTKGRSNFRSRLSHVLSPAESNTLFTMIKERFSFEYEALKDFQHHYLEDGYFFR